MLLTRVRFLMLVKVACYAGAGFLAGFVLGVALAALIVPAGGMLLGAAGAAVGGAAGTMLAGWRAAPAPAPQFSRRAFRISA